MRRLFTALLLALCIAPARALSYSEWIADFPSLSGEAAAPSADPDGDGMANLLEFALDGLDPTVMNSRAGVTVCYQQTRNEDGTYNTPALALTKAQRTAAASLHAVLRWKPRAGIEGVVFVPQTSQEDLQRWGWGDSAVTEWDSDGYRWARADSDALVWKDRAFMRLKVELP